MAVGLTWLLDFPLSFSVFIFFPLARISYTLPTALPELSILMAFG